eukprot:1285398-Rhodomonas_salina.1
MSDMYTVFSFKYHDTHSPISPCPAPCAGCQTCQLRQVARHYASGGLRVTLATSVATATTTITKAFTYNAPWYHISTRHQYRAFRSTFVGTYRTRAYRTLS